MLVPDDGVNADDVYPDDGCSNDWFSADDGHGPTGDESKLLSVSISDELQSTSDMAHNAADRHLNVPILLDGNCFGLAVRRVLAMRKLVSSRFRVSSKRLPRRLR